MSSPSSTDPSRRCSVSQEMELLGLFANQAAIAVDLLLKARKANLVLQGKGELEPVSRLAAAVDALEDERREAGLRLLRELAATLGTKEGL